MMYYVWMLLAIVVVTVEPIPIEGLVLEEEFAKPIEVQIEMDMMCTMRNIVYCMEGAYYLLDHSKGKLTKERILGVIPFGCFPLQHSSHSITLLLADSDHERTSYQTAMVLYHNCSTNHGWRELDVQFPQIGVFEQNQKYQYEIYPENNGKLLKQAKVFDGPAED